MLRWRLLTSLPLIAVLVGLCYLDVAHPLLGVPGTYLIPLALLITLAATGEVLDLLRTRDLAPRSWVAYVGTLLVVVAAYVPMLWKLFGRTYPSTCPLGEHGWLALAMAVGIGLAFAEEMRRYEQPGGSILRIAAATFVIGYVGLLFAYVVKLRLFHDNATGMSALVSMIVVAKMADTGAYFTGKSLGRHKLAPVLSPKKTIEGLIGGAVFACLAGWLFFRFLYPVIVGRSASIPLLNIVVYGLILTLAGLFGDLAESLLKRDMERKDSSSWLPGLGGVLDILDSLLGAGLPAYLCWVGGLLDTSG